MGQVQRLPELQPFHHTNAWTGRRDLGDERRCTKRHVAGGAVVGVERIEGQRELDVAETQGMRWTAWLGVIQADRGDSVVLDGDVKLGNAP